MKNTILYSLAVGTILLLTVSCEDFLDKQPYASVSDDIALATLADCETALNGVYASIRGRYLPEGLSVYDIMTDNVVVPASWRNTYLDVYRYNFSADNDVMYNLWFNAYICIARANNILEVIDSKEGDEAAKKRIKGACLTARAWAHFDLVRAFAKPYDPVTANSDPGVPYVFTTTLDMKTRNTVQEVYDYLIADLRMVVDEQLLTGSNIDYLTDAAARLLLSRAYLYVGEDQNVIQEYTDFQAIYASTYAVETDTAEFRKVWTADTGKEIIFRIPIASNEFLLSRSMRNFWLGDDQPGGAKPEFIPTKNGANGLYDLYESGDARVKIFFRDIETAKEGAQTLVYKYMGNAALASSFNINALKIFRYPELVLNYAEALARTGNSGAVGAVNSIRQARLATPYVSFADKNDALEKIYLERRLEYCFEGHYWHDMKRYKKGFERVLQPGAHLAMAALTVSPEDFHWVWPIPVEEINGNTVIEQNPNY
jgi:hypothetical protein